MTRYEKAVQLVDKFEEDIGSSDFHIPEFITGIKMGSKEYSKVLEDETRELAKICAINTCETVIRYTLSFPKYVQIHYGGYWEEVKKEIEKL